MLINHLACNPNRACIFFLKEKVMPMKQNHKGNQIYCDLSPEVESVSKKGRVTHLCNSHLQSDLQNSRVDSSLTSSSPFHKAQISREVRPEEGQPTETAAFPSTPSPQSGTGCLLSCWLHRALGNSEGTTTFLWIFYPRAQLYTGLSERSCYTPHRMMSCQLLSATLTFYVFPRKQFFYNLTLYDMDVYCVSPART